MAVGACAALVWQAVQGSSSDRTVASASASSREVIPPAASIAAAKPAAEEAELGPEKGEPGSTPSAEEARLPDGPKPEAEGTPRQVIGARPRVPAGQASGVGQKAPKQSSGNTPGPITDFGGRRY